jgi:hypothetical protein
MRKLDALFFRKLTALAIDWISTPLPHARLQRRRGNFALVAAPMATVVSTRDRAARALARSERKP